jgi:hypothetical protein
MLAVATMICEGSNLVMQNFEMLGPESGSITRYENEIKGFYCNPHAYVSLTEAVDDKWIDYMYHGGYRICYWLTN